jgi:hypothetical protein
MIRSRNGAAHESDAPSKGVDHLGLYKDVRREQQTPEALGALKIGRDREMVADHQGPVNAAAKMHRLAGAKIHQ